MCAFLPRLNGATASFSSSTSTALFNKPETSCCCVEAFIDNGLDFRKSFNTWVDAHTRVLHTSPDGVQEGGPLQNSRHVDWLPICGACVRLLQNCLSKG